MFWLFLATLTAFFESFKDVASKQSLKKVDVYLVTWSLFLFSLPVLLPLLFIIKIPILGENFGISLICDGTLNMIACFLYTKALQYSDLSITVPLVTLSPLFLLITSPLMIHEYPTIQDCLGIGMIVIGSYILNLKQKKYGYFAPFRALIKEKGSQLMLGVVFIWSITANIDKIGVRNSSPIFWAICHYSYITILMLPILYYKSRHNLNQLKSYWFSLLPMGLFQGLALICQMKAIEIALVTQVISVKRMSVLLSVIFGYLIFKESGIQERIMGATIMVLGVILISM